MPLYAVNTVHTKHENDKPTVEEKKKNESHDESVLHSTKH